MEELKEKALENPRILNLLMFLKGHKDQWWYADILCEQVGYKNQLSIRQAIKQLRLLGHPIIADIDKGYNYSTNIAQIKQYCTQRFGEIQAELNPIQKMYDKVA